MNNKITAVKSTYDHCNVPADIEVTAAFIAGTDAEINAGTVEETGQSFSDLQPGTMIHSAGYAVIKEKALDGSWVQL